jgi:hypothetical protein
VNREAGRSEIGLKEMSNEERTSDGREKEETKALER